MIRTAHTRTIGARGGGAIRRAGIAAAFALGAGLASAAEHVAADAAADDARFLAANIEWVLDHELAHTLIDAFDLAVPGDEEDAADAFASAAVSARHGEREAAERLALVAEAWFLASDPAETADEPGYFDAHDLDRARAFRVLCVARGGDAAVADAALAYADVPDGGFDGCEVDRDLATETWDVLLGPHALFEDEPPADITVSYGPADGLEPERDALRATGALEALAEEASTLYALFDPLVLEGRVCGGTRAPEADEGADGSADGGTIVVCYELVADLLRRRENAREAARAADAGDAESGAASAEADAVPSDTEPAAPPR